MLRSTLYVAAALVGIQGALARPIQGLERAEIEEAYDFIIAGGGTAGLVVANRLTESGKHRVLVLEAGPDPSIVAAYKPLGGNQLLAGSAVDWRFDTVPQEGLDGKILTYYRGRGLGGSSVINGFYYGRGTSTVYDRWQDLGNPGWSWADVYPLFIKGTHFNPQDETKGFDNTYKTWDPSAYSDGPLEIAYQGYVPPTGIAFMHACEAANIPIVHDYNTGNSTGVKQGTATLDANLLRSSSYDGYLKKAINRTNLDVLYYAPVQRLLWDTEGEKPRATGVQFLDHPTGRMYQVHAAKEVVVSMGAFQTPQLLMVSGFGPAAELEKFGIEPVHINENIGQHLDDHSVFSIMATVADEFSTSQYADFDLLQEIQEEFYTNGTGVYTAPSGITNGFQRLSEEELREIGAGAVVDAGLGDQSHIEYLFESIFYPGGPTPYYTPLANESYISLTVSSMVALSRGNITLRGTSMSAAPNINPNYYTHDADRAIAIQGFKYLRKILAHPELAKFTYGPNNGEVSPGAAISDDDDEAIFEYVKANTIPNWHASGTARMRREDDGGVVDARLKPYGVDGLRIVDCSIIPVLPDVNIVGPVFMIGEKGAQLIRILGREIVNRLGEHPDQWQKVYALSRSKKGAFPSNTQHNSIDLTGSADDMAKSLEGVKAEYVFFAAYLQKDTEQENWDVNGDMLQSFLTALDKSGAAKSVKRIVLVTGAKQYGVHLGPPKNPMLESDPWLRDEEKFPPNFYYRQQDVLKDFCSKSNGKIEWTVTYPNDVIGVAKGNFMNLATALGLYAAVNKEMGNDLAFPGSEAFYLRFDCFTEAKLHAEFCEWAALEPKAANEAFNVVNGDVESWQNLWPMLARRFGMKVKEDQFVGEGDSAGSTQLNEPSPLSVFEEESGLKGRVGPGTLEHRIDLVKWSQRDDVRKTWEKLAEREGLEKDAFEKATWGFLVFILGRAYDLVISMSKAREIGWTGYKDTWKAFSDVFGQLEAEKILPKTH
ncbi:hypothetical protein ACHAQH_009515 [Verticillium albo-atrum]